MNYPNISASSITSSIISDRLDFIDILNKESESTSFFKRIDTMKFVVKKTISERIASQSAAGPMLVGFVIDMFFTSMIDVADELGVPTYVYYASNALFLALQLHVQKLRDDQGLNIADFEDSHVEFSLPEFLNSVPARLLPSPAFEKVHGFSAALNIMARNFGRTKGILVNSFIELESYAVRSMDLDPSIPSIYPVGPVIKMESRADFIKSDKERMIMEWLDSHPPSSVVILCFGNMYAFGPAQGNVSWNRVKWLQVYLVAQAACIISSYDCPSRGLPRLIHNSTSGVFGSHSRDTKGDQLGTSSAVLSHPSIGGFVTHCGWNSILESLWFGVPIATWPLYAEQQLNAFEVVKEMGTGVEISVDYRFEMFMSESKIDKILSAEYIETNIRQLMEEESEVKKKVKLMKEKCRAAVVEGGSSYTYLQQFLDDLRKNISL